MIASLRALLAESIDYAGIFPPARLRLSEAMRNYAHYRQQDEAWMLGRFVCPASRLAELPVAGEALNGSAPLRFSAIARGGETAEQFLANLSADINDIQAFQTLHDKHVLGDVLEVRLPPEVFAGDDYRDAVHLLNAVSDTIHKTGLLPMTIFCESPAWENVERLIGVLSTQYSVHRTQSSSRPFGVKLRTGGLDAAAFPSPEQLAAAIAACRDAGVFWKATAGLHQPLRHFDATLETWQHGFVNILAAAVFADAHKLDEFHISQILQADSGDRFRFDDEALVWHDLRVDTDQIRTARQRSLVSFGSCSFTEPCDGLRAYGWL